VTYLIGPDVDTPRNLPGFRMWLQKQWAPTGLFTQAALLQSEDKFVQEHDTYLSIDRRFDARALPDAGLYWVDKEICSLVQQTAPNLPRTTLTPELTPEPKGFIWLEEPLIGQPAADVVGITDPIVVRAILWGPARIPPGREALGIGLYGDRNLDEGKRFFYPLGRTDWIPGTDTDEPITDTIGEDEQRSASMAEDRRFLATILLLMGQTNVTEQRTTEPAKQAKRKVQRAGFGTDVRVISARRRPHEALEDPTGQRPVDWSHRWIVGAHWKQVVYGPGGSLRRPQLILPYIKGPEDKPLLTKDTVRVLKDS